MREKKKRKLRKFKFHPVTSLILLTLGTVILSFVLSKFHVQASYRTIDPNSLEFKNVIVSVENLFNYNGFKMIISDAAKNFASFSALTTLLIGLIGVSVAHASGLIDAFIKRVTINANNKLITFFLILIAIISSLINEIGYVVLIPLGALIFLANKRNPMLGITAAFCGVAFGYGTSLFVGSMEVSLIEQTRLAASVIDAEYHIALLSNVFIMVASTIVLAIVGTIIVENIIVKKIGRYKADEETLLLETASMQQIDLDDIEKVDLEVREKRGLRWAYVVGFLMILLFIYMIIPNIPGSGILLDKSEYTYLNQLFGSKSYFQDGFTYMVSLWFFFVGIAYAIGAKSVKNDKELFEKASTYLRNVGHIIIIMFFFVQFISIFKETNIGVVIACFGADLIQTLNFTGLPLILLALVVIAIAGILLPSSSSKWTIFSPVLVPMMMQGNISPEFAQFVFRAADSMTKGLSPILGYFVIYLGYLNIYNTKKEPVTMKKALSFVYPYCLIIAGTWILITVGWYLLGLPIGPNVYPTL